MVDSSMVIERYTELDGTGLGFPAIGGGIWFEGIG